MPGHSYKGTRATTILPTFPDVIYSTPNYVLTDGSGSVGIFAHGQSSPPKYIRIVIVCVSPDADSGSSVGQEWDAQNLSDFQDGLSAFGVWADATNIQCQYSGAVGGNSTQPGSPGSFSDFGNFVMKAYWSP